MGFAAERALDILQCRATKPEHSTHEWLDVEDGHKWQEVISDIKKRWREVEWRSVAVGIRPCALMTISASDLPSYSQAVADEGLTLIPLERLAVNDGYASRLIRAPQSERGPLFCVVTKTCRSSEFLSYWAEQSHREIGRLLGYPLCCIEFFDRTWPVFTDPTWAMAHNSPDCEFSRDGLACTGRGAWQANTMLRWIGVRAVPHLPCSFDCQRTVAFANQLSDVLEPTTTKLLLEEMLSWPIEWTSFAGMAEIRTAGLEIRTSTDIFVKKGAVRVAWRESHV